MHSSLTTNYHLHTLYMMHMVNVKTKELWQGIQSWTHNNCAYNGINDYIQLHKILSSWSPVSFSICNNDFQLWYNDQSMIQKLRKTKWIGITLFAALKMFHLITHHCIYAQFYTIILEKHACYICVSRIIANVL